MSLSLSVFISAKLTFCKELLRFGRKFKKDVLRTEVGEDDEGDEDGERRWAKQLFSSSHGKSDSK